MKGRRLALRVLDGTFAICRLDAGAELPARLLGAEFLSVTRTPDELSIVAPEKAVRRAGLPAGIRIEGGWACLKVEGTLDLSLTGVLAALSGALARAGVALFAVSTYDTDYLLVRKRELDAAVAALSAEGHAVAGPAED